MFSCEFKSHMSQHTLAILSRTLGLTGSRRVLSMSQQGINTLP